MFLGIVLLLVSLLLFLALASYHPADPSLNTSTDLVAARNWVGLFGAYIADLLLQALGLTSFLLPIWMGGVGWTWMRSRPGGSPILRGMGTLLTLVFLPAVFGLLPWHWRWLHAVPVEGVAGRLMAGFLVVYLNVQGAWLVAAALAACGLYFASAISFSVVRESVAEHWVTVSAWLDRWRAQREERDELRAEREAQHSEGKQPIAFSQHAPQPGELAEEELPVRRTNRFLAFFLRNRTPQQDPIDEIPAFRRERFEQPEDAIPVTQTRKPSIWERSEPGPVSAAPAPAPITPLAPPRAVPAQPLSVQPAAAHPVEQWMSRTPERSHRAIAARSRRNRHSRPRRCRGPHRHGCSQECERFQASIEHFAERRRGPAVGA